jgi:prepilin peptidase CpaA
VGSVFRRPPSRLPGQLSLLIVLAFSGEGSEKAKNLGNFGMSKIHSELLYPVVALACALTGSVFDLRNRRIPNLLTLPGILFGLLLHLALDGWNGLGHSALAGLIAFVVFVIFWLAGGMGAGDVKLITAIGCILGGSMHVVWLLIYTALAGGVMAVGLALWRGRLKDTIMNLGALVLHHRFEGLRPHPQLNVGNAQTLRLPYALAIAAGSAVTVCMTVVQR